MCPSCELYYQHPDFRNDTLGRDYNVIQSMLDTEGKPIFCEQGYLTNAACGQHRTVTSFSSFNSWYVYLSNLINRFHTELGINREYTLQHDGFSDGIHSFNSNIANDIINSIPLGVLYPLSEYEMNIKSKNWWTMELSDSIRIQETQHLTVT